MQAAIGFWGCCATPEAMQCLGMHTCCPKGTKCATKGGAKTCCEAGDPDCDFEAEPEPCDHSGGAT